MSPVHDLLAWAQALEWRHPWTVWLALMPLLGWGLRQWREERLAAYADPHLHAWALRPRPAEAGLRWRRLAEALAWLLLAAALAGPFTRGSSAASRQQALHTSRQALHIHVVVQVSDSMRAKDVSPRRLEAAALQLRDKLNRLHGESLSLIAYGADVALLLPPTRDMAVFREALPWLESELVPAQGQDLAAALSFAASRQPAASAQRHAVLLITDGQMDTQPGAGRRLEQAIEQLARRDMPAFVWSVQAEAKRPAATALASGRRDPAQLQALARRTGGRVVPMAGADAGWSDLYEHGLAALPLPAWGLPPAQEEQSWHHAPLALGSLLMVLALSAWRRYALVAWAALALGLAHGLAMAQVGRDTGPPSGKAGAPTQEQRAWQALQEKQWLPALLAYEQIGGFRGHWGAGFAALRGERHEQARQHFEMAWLLAPNPRQRTDALYNLGLALAAQERWDAAAETWEAVLQQRPQDRAARHNLAVAHAELRRRAQAGGVQDLYGRRGFTTQGRVQTDVPADVQEPATAAAAAGAGSEALTASRAAAAQPTEATTGFTLSDAHRRSARLKVERLTEQASTLQKGLIQRQDQPAYEPRIKELAP